MKLLKVYIVYFQIREVNTKIHLTVVAENEEDARRFAERAMSQSVTDDYIVTTIQELEMTNGTVIL